MPSVNREPDPPNARFELLPAIDLRGGRVVRLLEGDFARETVYGDDPVEVARRFVDEGARWLHIVDLDGARSGVRRQAREIAEVIDAVGRAVSCEIAGGLRDEAAVAGAFDAGAWRVVVGTAALRDGALVGRLIERYGPDRVAVALDVRDGRAVGEAWRSDAGAGSLEGTLDQLWGLGATTFEVTATARDGTLAGPDLDLLGRLTALVGVRVIASGGIASVEDILAVRRLGCVGAIVGRALYEGRVTLPAAIAALGREADDGDAATAS